MKHELMFKLTRVAKSGGGDRYETNFGEEPKPMVIYLPQSISRISAPTSPDGQRQHVVPMFKVTIEVAE